MLSQHQCTEGLIDLASLLGEGDGCIPIGRLGALEPALLGVRVARGLHACAKEPQTHNECFPLADTHAAAQLANSPTSPFLLRQLAYTV